MYKNIKFTSEVGNDSLAFLDTYIELPKAVADSVKCSVYRKKTFTSLIMNFFCSVSIKVENRIDPMSIAQSLSNKRRLDHNVKGVGIPERSFQEEWLSRQIILNMSADILEQQVHHQQTKAKGGWCRDSLPNTIH